MKPTWPLILLLALPPRLAALAARPFWYDEVVTLQRAGLPLPALLRDALAHHHLPTYFLLVAPLAGLPHPQFWLRLPSAVCGALAVALAYLIARRAAGETAGLAAAAILGLSPTAIAFSQDARCYALLLCLILLALHGLLTLACAADTTWRAKRGAWIGFTAGTAGALCVSGDALPWWLGAALTAAWLVRRAPDRAGLGRRFLAANAVAAGAALPGYIAMLALQQTSVAESLSWIPAPTPPLLWYDIGSTYLLRVADFTNFAFMPVATPAAVTTVISAVLGLAGAAGLWRAGRQPAVLATLLAAFLALPVLLGLISLRHALLLPRYVFWSAGPFAVIAGIGAAAILARLGRWRHATALASLAVLVLNLLPFYHAETKARWDLAARRLAVEARPGDVFYLSQWGAGPTIRYYLPPRLRPALLTDWQGDLAHAVSARAAGHRVWAIYGDAGQTTFSQSWPSFRASLAPLGTPTRTEPVGARVFITLYGK